MRKDDQTQRDYRTRGTSFLPSKICKVVKNRYFIPFMQLHNTSNVSNDTVKIYINSWTSFNLIQMSRNVINFNLISLYFHKFQFNIWLSLFNHYSTVTNSDFFQENEIDSYFYDSLKSVWKQNRNLIKLQRNKCWKQPWDNISLYRLKLL